MASLAASSMVTEEKRHRFSFLHRHKRSSESLSTLAQSQAGDAAPQYEKHEKSEKRASKSVSSDDSDNDTLSSPPNYSSLYGDAEAETAPAVDGVFRPTLQLQIDTLGKSQCSDFAQMSRPDPVYIHLVDNQSGAVLYDRPPAYVSLRKKRSSNSCTLVSGGGYSLLHAGGGVLSRGSSSSSHRGVGEHQILSTTTYRVGPGRPPRVSLFDASQTGGLESIDEAGETTPWDHFEFSGKSIFNRVQHLRSRLGTFEWRYASRDERKALSKELIDAAAAAGSSESEKDLVKRNSVNNLMILERVVQVYGSISPGNSDASGSTSSASAGKPREVRRPVARMIRSKALRTPGSSKHSAGNGGRLQLDLHEWMTAANEAALGDRKSASASDPGFDEHTDREMVVLLAVVTCISMLKKENDRRRDAEIVAVV